MKARDSETWWWWLTNDGLTNIQTVGPWGIAVRCFDRLSNNQENQSLHGIWWWWQFRLRLSTWAEGVGLKTSREEEKRRWEKRRWWRGCEKGTRALRCFTQASLCKFQRAASRIEDGFYDLSPDGKTRARWQGSACVSVSFPSRGGSSQNKGVIWGEEEVKPANAPRTGSRTIIFTPKKLIIKFKASFKPALYQPEQSSCSKVEVEDKVKEISLKIKSLSSIVIVTCTYAYVTLHSIWMSLFIFLNAFTDIFKCSFECFLVRFYDITIKLN